MEISTREKNILCFFIIVLFSFLSLHSLCAQSSGSYKETRYIQRLTWLGDEYVTKYEVVIEQEEEGGFTFKLSEFTNAEFIEISLPPGNYRFRVIPYDFRDLPEQGTEWKEFVILPAPAEEPPADVLPEEYLTETVPAEAPLEEAPPEVIEPPSIELPQPEFPLRGENPEVPEELPADEIFTPAAEADKGKPVDFLISAFYMPSIPLYANELSEPAALGAAFRFGILFTNPVLFKPGIELAARWNTIGNKTDKHAIDAELNILIQKPMTNGKTAFMLRFGAGLTAFSIPAGNTALTELFYANIAFSFLWQPINHFFLETGFAYSHHFSQPAVSGSFRPFIGIGTQF